MATKERKNHEK